ncbi:MAG: phenylacetate--CoA ligase [Eggerthellaceae bacterium]|nr:phenylacetate--CoA ligase [Eggerthellaceae bacterium]MCH4220591.1 phenylacetate--CoA ligase [Eggerthellaceae bacterium]
MFFQQDIETMSTDRLRSLQLKRLQHIVSYVYDRIPFYHTLFDANDCAPDTIRSLDDLQKFPFTTKQDMRAAYPFGMFATPREDVVRIHCSSGTTGTATVVGYTKSDLNNWANCFARAIYAAGAGPSSVMQIAYGYGLFTGGLGAHAGGERAGCSVLPMSTGNTDRQIRLMRDFGTDLLCCTPSYALLIANKAIEKGYDPAHDFRISAGVMGAEPYSNNMRKEIEHKLGIKVLDIYGLSEIMGPGVANECENQQGLHVNEDQFIIEIIDPQTLQPVPDGEYGEVVFTTLCKQCSPLIRYRTRDISRIIPGECSCGRTFRRMDRIAGRTDDMLIIRGVNVFPSQIEEVITSFAEITSFYQIVLTNQGPLDHVQLLVEPVPEFPFDEIRKIEDLKHRLGAELKKNLQVSVEIKIVEPKTIERTSGKARRIIDNRKEQ